jgi:glycosyltransferase involved in cell wall biosynthesis
MSVLVSVIIPCKNAGLWLKDAIESCLTQTWPNIEIIVVDNGSVDESVAVARSYSNKSIKVLECGRKGASAARNVGLQHAHGAFVQFLDADDVLDRDKIRLQVERLKRSPVGTIASASWSQFRNLPGEVRFAPEPVWRDLKPEEFLISSWLGGGMMPPFAWLTPRPVIEKAGLWNEDLSLNDDGEFFTRAILASAGIVYCADAKGYYRKTHTLSLSNRRDAEALTSAFTSVHLSCQHLLERCSSDEAARACACNFQRLIFDLYPQKPELIKLAEQRVIELGGSALKIGGGRLLQFIAACLGWKFARRCQLLWRMVRKVVSEQAMENRQSNALGVPRQ